MLSKTRVMDVLMDCFFRQDELIGSGDRKRPIPGVPVTQVTGPNTEVGFHTERLMGYKAEITSWLNDLTDTFKTDGSNSACSCKTRFNKTGEEWNNDDDKAMEAFCLLTIGVGVAKLRKKTCMGGTPWISFSKDGVFADLPNDQGKELPDGLADMLMLALLSGSLDRDSFGDSLMRDVTPGRGPTHH
jgi:hypothetical protein